MSTAVPYPHECTKETFRILVIIIVASAALVSQVCYPIEAVLGQGLSLDLHYSPDCTEAFISATLALRPNSTTGRTTQQYALLIRKVCFLVFLMALSSRRGELYGTFHRIQVVVYINGGPSDRHTAPPTRADRCSGLEGPHSGRWSTGIQRLLMLMEPDS